MVEGRVPPRRAARAACGAAAAAILQARRRVGAQRADARARAAAAHESLFYWYIPSHWQWPALAASTHGGAPGDQGDIRRVGFALKDYPETSPDNQLAAVHTNAKWIGDHDMETRAARLAELAPCQRSTRLRRMGQSIPGSNSSYSPSIPVHMTSCARKATRRPTRAAAGRATSRRRGGCCARC